MKILHTADWHLGKKLDRFPRLEEQKQAMEEIVRIADREKADLILIAGDLFDTFTPPADAADLFYRTITKLSRNGRRPVVAISGNHDSPAYIDAPNSIARQCGIILIGQPNATVTLLKQDDFEVIRTDAGFLELKFQHLDFPVRVFHTAYASEIRMKMFFGENKEDELNRVLAEHWKKMAENYADEKGVNLLMTHLYMNRKGSETIEEPEGEKPLKIGNADMVYSDAVPHQIQYTALGHLHGFRNIGTQEKPVVYSSSPLCYSFSEAGQDKYVSIIDAEPGKPVTFRQEPLHSGKKLFRKTFTSVEKATCWLQENPDTLVELTMESETFLTAEERRQLYKAHQGIVYLIPKVTNMERGTAPVQEINLNQDMDALFRDFFRCKNGGQDPNEELMKIFSEIRTK